MNFFVKLFFKKKLDNLENKTNQFISQINNLHFENYTLKEDLKTEKNKFERIKFLLNERLSNFDKVRIERTEKGILTLILFKFDPLIMYIYDIENREIYSDHTLSVLTTSKQNTLHIDDIQGGNNIGHGSLAMKFIVEFARKQNYKAITGKLSYVDIDHKERLIHFYKKHGFNIVLIDNDRFFGSINLNLK